MIHDDLTRHFEDARQPSLSPEFSMNLRRRLHAVTPGKRRSGLLVWAPRLYWVVAIALLVRYWRPVTLTPLQTAVLAMAGAAFVLTLRRAMRSGSLTRAVRDTLR